jgi:hypothetical protein
MLGLIAGTVAGMITGAVGIAAMSNNALLIVRSLISPVKVIDELRDKLKEQEATASQATEAARLCSAKLADVDFRAEARKSPAQPLQSCQQSDEVVAVVLRSGEGRQFLGGRLYAGTTSIAGAYEHLWCKVYTSSDVAPGSTSGLMYPGETRVVKSSIGEFIVGVTSVSRTKDGDLCTISVSRRNKPL